MDKYRGRKIITFRIDEDLLHEIEIMMMQRNKHSPNAPMDRSKWIIAAIREKIRHAKAGRKSRGKAKA